MQSREFGYCKVTAQLDQRLRIRFCGTEREASPLRSLCCAAVLAGIAWPALSQSSILGEWANFRNGGADNLEQGLCVARVVEERRYRVMPSRLDGAEYDAVYAAIVHWHWIVHKKPDCALPDLQTKSAYMQMRTWGVDLAPVASGIGKYKAAAKFMKCVGEYCAAKYDYWQKPFTSTLDFSVSGLLTDDPRDGGVAPMTYRPLSDLQRESNAIAREFLDALAALRTGAFAGFVDRRVQMTIIPRTRDDMAAEMERYYHGRLENHAGYEIVQAYKFDAVKGQWPELPITHVVVSHKQSDGTQVGETLELVLDGGVWKLLVLT